MRVKMTRQARSSKVARSHILAAIERCLNGNGVPIELDYGKYVISACGYYQRIKRGTRDSGVRVTWRTL